MKTTSGNDWLWVSTRWAIYARDGFQCVACGKLKPEDGAENVKRGDMLSVDHVEPMGGNVPCNLVTLCVSCNSSKKHRSISDWRPELDAVIKAAAARQIDRVEGRRLAALARPDRIRRNRSTVRRAKSPEAMAARAAALEGVPF